MTVKELEILSAYKQNQHFGQRLLYISYAPILKGICYRYIKDRDHAQDVLQDSFIKIFKSIQNFDQKGSLEGWLKRVVVNTALDALKSTKIKNEIEFSEAYEPEADSISEEDMVSQILEAGFSKEVLLGVLNELTGMYGTVFNLFYIDGISHKEIAEMLQITEGNSRKLAFRAKEQVKEALIKKFNP